MTTFQLVTLPLLALMIVATGVATTRHRVPPRVGMTWIIIWLAAAVAIAFPDLLVKLARWAGIGRGADLVLYLFILFMLGALFMIYVRFRRVEEQLTEIVRHLAVSEGLRQAPPAEQRERLEEGR